MTSSRIAQDKFYPHPPQRVWAALTESAELAQWLLPNDFVPRVGHRFRLREQSRQGWSDFIEGEVIEVVPYRRLAYTWLAHPRLPQMTVRFTLHPVPGGTHLHLEQTAWATAAWQATPARSLLLPLDLAAGGPRPMSRFFRLMVDEVALTDALFNFVTDANANSRNALPVVEELHTFAPEMIDVLEHMILDGVEERIHIEEYVHAVFGPMAR
jgi:uncharacterized protein YndB with AHSA1/START domain